MEKIKEYEALAQKQGNPFSELNAQDIINCQSREAYVR